MKKIIFISIILYPFLMVSQVGIGTTDPKSLLDIKVLNISNPTNEDGILIPRISDFPTTDPTADQNGMLIYHTGNKNFYYWENSAQKWLPFVKKIDDLIDGKSSTDFTDVNLRHLFLGVDAGASYNTSNKDAIGIGYKAMESITTGDSNVAIGANSLKSNTVGNYNIGIGTSTLQNNITGAQNIAIGYQSQMFADNNTYNVSIGFQSLWKNTTGGQNTAFGSQSLTNNLGGNYNVAIGASTLFANTNALHNVAIGSGALRSKVVGNTNVGIGSNSLSNMTSGGNNVAIGANSMLHFDNGGNNTAIGHAAMFGSTSATVSSASNVAIGYNALYNNTSGSDNTVIGFRSLFYNQTGNSNVVIGKWANWTTPTSNLSNITVIGTNANAKGNGSTAIGYGAIADGVNSMALGNGASVTGNNTIHIGNSLVTYIKGQVDFSIYSDKRIKDNIKENVIGLDFIKKLRPVTYNLSVHKQNSFLGIIDNSKDKEYETEKIRRTGFIAQEVEAVANKIGYDFSGVVKPKNKKELYGLSYAAFVVPLVKGMQEQALVIEDLIKQIKALTKKVKKLEKNKK